MTIETKILSIGHMQGLAKLRGGWCLSTYYINAKKHLRWKCGACQNEWKAIPDSIRKGTWCPECKRRKSGSTQRLTIEDMCAVARSRGGQCLSTTYTNSGTKLKWQCATGHAWDATPGSVRHGSWCPHCRGSYGEEICRAHFEQILNAPFPRSRPEWLVTLDGARMELDGYNEKLGIAFEHQGSQHSALTIPFIENQMELKTLRERDRQKALLCEEKGVLLILVPEVPKKLPPIRLKKFIFDQCRERARLPTSTLRTNVSLERAFSNRSALQLEKYRLIATERGGELLSKTYCGNEIKLRWKCRSNHEWEARPGNVLMGKWCPECKRLKSGASQRLTITHAKVLAKKIPGKCLSVKYSNARSYLKWSCDEAGHVWHRTYDSMRGSPHCPQCSGVRT